MIMLNIYAFTGLLIGAAINLAFQLTDPPGAPSPSSSIAEVLVCSVLSAAATVVAARLLFLSPRSANFHWQGDPRQRTKIRRLANSTDPNLCRSLRSMVKFPITFPLRPLRPSRELQTPRPARSPRNVSVTH